MVTNAPKLRWYQFSLLDLLVVMLASCFVFAWVGQWMKQAPEKTYSWSEISTPPAQEGPDNRHVISVLHGVKKGEWILKAQSNVSPETQVRIGRKLMLLPETKYGWRYYHYETGEGDILLHLYLREAQEINSPTNGKNTYKFDDAKDDLVSRFRRSSEWEVLSNKPDAGDGE